MHMPIFPQEIADGLEQLLATSASISYANLASPCSITKKSSLEDKIKSIASYNDEDLYYSQAILVTSSWNKNDDIFDKYEIWAAKRTPEHKPTNLEHNEGIIVGHIISNWPITDTGEIIQEDIKPEDLPDKYHILTGSVIYRGFTIPELKERADKLIAEIDSGKKYVSMECFFKGFDYGILNKETGNYKILARNNETAYLTKYLRSYGGAGEHEDYRIGRVLRNITFSGKGYVDRPANEDSIIFSYSLVPEKQIEPLEEKNKEIAQLGVSIPQSNNNSETNIMPKAELNKVETEVEVEADAKAETQVVEETVVTQPVAEADTTSAEILALKTENEKLAADIANLNEKIAVIEVLKEEAAKKDKMVKDAEEQKQKMKAELDAALEAVAGYQEKEKDAMKKDKMFKRKASLVDRGVDDETAASVVEKFESMDDDSFEAMASMFSSFAAKKTDDKKKMPEEAKDNVKCSASVTDPAVLDEVVTEEEVNLSIASDDSAVDSISEGLANFVRSRFNK
jgi:hypothetical protein